LLNAILDYQTGVEEAQASGITVEDFATDWNRRMWNAMVKLRAQGEGLDLMRLCEELVAAGMRGDDAARLIADTLEGCTLGHYVPQYSARVKHDSLARRLAKALELANQRVAEGEQPEWAANEAVEEIQRLRYEQGAAPQASCSLAEIIPQFMADLRDRMYGDQKKLALPTGIPELDDLTTGINREELWIVGGMPGRGKTAFGLQVALQVAAKGMGACFMSLEMSRAAVIRRLLKMQFGAAVAETPGSRWEEVEAYTRDLQTLPLSIRSLSSAKIEEIVAQAHLEIQSHKASLIIVDYLQLIRMPHARDRREAMGEATDALRILAKDTGVPVMLLSQLRRPYSLNDRPSMIDLKESGDIEAHAHVVLLMYFPVTSEREFPPQEQPTSSKPPEAPAGPVTLWLEC